MIKKTYSTPPHLEKSINRAYLENGTYDHIVNHLERERERERERDGAERFGGRRTLGQCPNDRH